MPCARMHCAYASAFVYADDAPPDEVPVALLLLLPHAASATMPRMASKAPIHPNGAGRGRGPPDLSFFLRPRDLSGVNSRQDATA